MRQPRSVLADEHRLTLDALQLLVGSELDVVGTARNGRALLDLAQQLRPDLVLTEVTLPLLNGIETVARIRKRLPRTIAVFLTKHSGRQHLTAALHAGASGYLTKDCSASEVLSALREIKAGRSYITPLVTADLFSTVRESITQDDSAELTQRQKEILQLIVEGHTIKEIAVMLNISRKTVEYHKYSLMQTLGLETNTQLLQFAIGQGFEPRVVRREGG